MFLYAIALLNVVVLVGILRVFTRLRRGEYDSETDGAELERQLDNRGVMNRFLGRFTKSITKSWHSYPVGLLFGLGFDTATEIALLVLAGTSAAAGLPWYAILCLPVLFTAGMCLLDTIDGSFMNFAYGWAFSNPVRKIYYNITITALSVVGRAADRQRRTAHPVRRAVRLAGRVLELDRRAGPQRRRLFRRGHVRHHLGGGPARLALRSPRTEMDFLRATPP